MFISEIDVAICALHQVVRHTSELLVASPNTGIRLGYTRVSTIAQTLDQQNAALEAVGVTKTFSDVMCVKALTDKRVTLVTTDGIDSSTPAGHMMIGLLGSLAEYERELVKERTALRRQASRANGTKFGRPKSVNDPQHIATARRMKADGHTVKDIAQFLGVSRATQYRYLATV